MRNFIPSFLVSLCGLAIGQSAMAQAFPNKPIRIIAPVVAGSSPDARVRQVAPRLEEALGQPIVVENHPGANGALGARIAARAEPDGYTLFAANTGNALNDLFSTDTSSRLNRELVAVTDLTLGPLVMVVNPAVPAKTLKEFLALARAKPGSLSYASGGAGSFIELLGEQMKRVANIDMLEVPYKSPGAELTDVMANHVQVAFGGLATMETLIKSGKLRALAVADSHRLSVLPDVPTMAEEGLQGTEAVVWNGIFAPAGTPPAVIQKLQQAFNKALNSPDVKNLYNSTGSEIGGSRPEAFAKFIDNEKTRWAKVIKDANIKLDQ